MKSICLLVLTVRNKSLIRTSTISYFPNFPASASTLNSAWILQSTKYFNRQILSFFFLFKTHHCSLWLRRNILDFLVGHIGSLTGSFSVLPGSQNWNFTCHLRKGQFKSFSHSDLHSCVYHGEPLAWLLDMTSKALSQGTFLASSSQSVLNKKMIL